MPKFSFVRSDSIAQLGKKKRRPAGISRRQKQRQLRFEPLEDRRVMSANPVASGAEMTAAEIRDYLLSPDIIRSFEITSDLSQYTQDQLLQTQEWVVLADLDADFLQQADTLGVNVLGETGIIPGSYFVSPGLSGAEGLIAGLSVSEAVDYFYPLIAQQAQQLAITNDPYLLNQWHLINFNQEVGSPNFGTIRGVVDEDINIEEAWDFVTGNGVLIGIVDGGIQTDHPDLAGNIRLDLAANFAGGGNLVDSHATAVAGLAAGVGNNGLGTTGVAYEADIVPMRLIGGTLFSDAQIAQAILYRNQEISVYNHSWGLEGTAENPRAITEFGPLSLSAIRSSVFFGRGGKGNVHVWAAGNEVGGGQSANYDGMVNSRYTIGVGGVGHDGSAVSYSENSAAILVVAPTGSRPIDIILDDDIGSGLWTTDLTGENGSNVTDPFLELPVNGGSGLDFFPDLDYSSRFNGNSGSAPIVSGVIALMLEANPNLTYRDIQHILVRSARQNDPLDISWAVNNRSFFVDPPYDASNPPPDMYWPFGFAVEAQAGLPPLYYTNAAGFTVSQYTTHGSDGMGGITSIGAGQEFGYGHGIIDAALAVRMAQSWQTVGPQQSEVTWTTGDLSSGTLAPAAVSSEETGEIRVPGAINGDGAVGDPNAFIEYFNEFGVESDPMADPPTGPFLGEDVPINTRGGVITIDGVSPMSIEWIEVELGISGEENAFDFLRIALVGPSGTVSELTSFARPTNDPLFQDLLDPNIGIGSFGDPAGVLDPGSGGFGSGARGPVVFSTNRHWGERAEEGPWTLVFENFSDSELDIQSYEVAFHGIGAANTTRVQGAIGIAGSGVSFDRTVQREAGQFAAGVFVYADLDADGIRDATEPLFVTGNDGNFFFDIANGVPFDIRIDPNGLPDYLLNQQNVDIANALLPGLNVMLVPNAVPAEIVTISGYVYADLNTNGVRDGNDSLIDGAEVFIDVDQNGVFTPGVDLFRTTAGGFYQFDMLSIAAGFYSVRVLTGTTGTFGEPVNPDDAEEAFFFEPGLVREDLNFGFTVGTGTGLGAISGVVYNDSNGSGSRQGSEQGLAGVATVYLDLNHDNQLDGGDIQTTTSANGSFVFNTLVPGIYEVRLDFDPVEFTQTTPAGNAPNNFEFSVNLSAGQIAAGLEFGLRSNALYDWGDLPSAFYPTTAAQDGPRHLVVGNLFLGAVVDTELDGQPQVSAMGDDLLGLDDEDGITFEFSSDGVNYGGLFLDTTTSMRITVVASQNGGWLQGWVDFNEDHAFGASERIFDDLLLPVGQSSFVVPVPTATLTSGTVYARFRFGEEGIALPTGVALKGEVEDYALTVVSTALDPGLQIQHGPDFNEDGEVSGLDFLAWQRGVGKTSSVTPADGDSNSDGVVDGQDLADWEAEYGTGGDQPQLIVETGDFDNDGDIDGSDFLAWQIGVGMANVAQLADGDGNSDGDVDAYDLRIWESGYGDSSALAAPLAVSQQPLLSGGSPSGTGGAPAASANAFSPAMPMSRSSLVSAGPSEERSIAASRNAASVNRPDLASLASEASKHFQHGSRFDGEDHEFLRHARIETQRTETSFKDSIDLLDLGFEMRDRALDRLFGRRERLFEQLPWNRDQQEDESADALEAVLGEEIEWRLL